MIHKTRKIRSNRSVRTTIMPPLRSPCFTHHAENSAMLYNEEKQRCALRHHTTPQHNPINDIEHDNPYMRDGWIHHARSRGHALSIERNAECEVQHGAPQLHWASRQVEKMCGETHPDEEIDQRMRIGGEPAALQILFALSRIC